MCSISSSAAWTPLSSKSRPPRRRARCTARADLLRAENNVLGCAASTPPAQGPANLWRIAKEARRLLHWASSQRATHSGGAVLTLVAVHARHARNLLELLHGLELPRRCSGRMFVESVAARFELLAVERHDEVHVLHRLLVEPAHLPAVLALCAAQELLQRKCRAHRYPNFLANTEWPQDQ